MVRVDTVYQRVLALVNKEQRGYITPQEFNLFAGHAQNAIFEQYFYDLNQFSRGKGNSDEYADMTDILQEKLALFQTKSTLTFTNGTATLPTSMYRLGTIIQTYQGYSYEVEKIGINELSNIMQTYLTRPTAKRPVYTQNAASGAFASNINISPITPVTTTVAHYVRKPKTPNWTYMVVGDKALYNVTSTDHQDFELHASEETSLVLKILTLSGLELQSPELYQTANQEDMKNIQQEKS